MSKLKAYDMRGAAAEDVEIPEEWLTLDRGEQAVHDAVVAYLAACRTGTASTLQRGRVAGSGRKPWKQKGTGRARVGSRRSPVWKGGGVAFGPHPRSYGMKLNKNVMRLAFRRVFSQKVAAGAVRVLNELVLPEAKTRLFVGLMEALGLEKGALFVDLELNKNVVTASRNVPEVAVANASNVSVYQLMRYPMVVITKSGIGGIARRLAGKGRAGGRIGTVEDAGGGAG